MGHAASSSSRPDHTAEPPPAPERGTTRAQLDASDLQAALTPALRHGARAARIAHYAPHLVEILYPDGSITAPYLAAVEDTIRAALDSIGGTDAEALSTLLGLAPGTLGMPLHDRRAAAARTLGIEPDTLRRINQRALLWDLAMEIYQAHPPGPPG